MERRITWQPLPLCWLPHAVSTFITAPDGLRLHAQCYGQRMARAATPVVLPARPRARTVADFEAAGIGTDALTASPRAASSRSTPADADDPVTTATTRQLFASGRTRRSFWLYRHCTPAPCPAIFIGTPRAVGSTTSCCSPPSGRPAIAAPPFSTILVPGVLEPQGLIAHQKLHRQHCRSRGISKKVREILRRLFVHGFQNSDRPSWLASAHRTFKEEKGRLVPRPTTIQLANARERRRCRAPGPRTLEGIRRARECAGLMVIREVQTPTSCRRATVEACREKRRVALETFQVPDRSHAPLMTDAGTIARIVGVCQPVRSIARRWRQKTGSRIVGARFNFQTASLCRVPARKGCHHRPSSVMSRAKARSAPIFAPEVPRPSTCLLQSQKGVDARDKRDDIEVVVLLHNIRALMPVPAFARTGSTGIQPWIPAFAGMSGGLSQQSYLSNSHDLAAKSAAKVFQYKQASHHPYYIWRGPGYWPVNPLCSLSTVRGWRAKGAQPLFTCARIPSRKYGAPLRRAYPESLRSRACLRRLRARRRAALFVAASATWTASDQPAPGGRLLLSRQAEPRHAVVRAAAPPAGAILLTISDASR